MRNTLYIFLFFIQVGIAQNDKNSSVGLSYRHGSFDGDVSANGFDVSFQYKIYNWLYAEGSIMHFSGSNFKNDFQVSTNPEQVENTDLFSDRAMHNSINIKLHLSFINTKKHLSSIYYGPSFFWYNSSTYDELYLNNTPEFWYKNSTGNGIGTVFGINYFYKINNNYKVGIDFMMFFDRDKYGSDIYTNHISGGLLIQKKI
ncbi:MAG: hypothetical protein ACQESK_05570 [Bacteroidota bacterium]